MSEQDPTTPRGLEPAWGPDTPADPTEAMPDYQGTAADHEEERGHTANALPPLVLAVVAFTVFDAVIVVVYIALWAIDFNLLLAALKGRGWISLLLAVTPLILGAIVVQSNKNGADKRPGTIWANAGMIVGVLMSLITLAVPMLTALAQMVSPCRQ